MAGNRRQASETMVSKAGKVLPDPDASAIARRLAAPALAQSGTGKQTGAAMEAKAARVLESSKYASVTHSLAGTVLSQSRKDR